MKRIEQMPSLRTAFRFAVSGLLTTGLHVLIATFFIKTVAVTPPLANGIAFILATLFSCVVNTKWSFSQALQAGILARFFAVSSLGLVLSILVSGAAQYAGLHYWYGIFFVVCVVPPVTFLLHNYWTYR